MSEKSFEAQVAQGERALRGGNTMVALMHFESAAKLDTSPMLQSYLGYCYAVERNEVKKGLALCREAALFEPTNSRLWLNLGRLCLYADKKKVAIEAFRRGLKFERNAEIIGELKGLGMRKPPVFASLDRSHPINRHVGKVLYELGLR